MGWTRQMHDQSGRAVEVQTFDGSGLPAPWGTNSVSTGKVLTGYNANQTLVTDQAGKQRMSQSNGLGQLTDVWEITPADSATEWITFPGTGIVAGYRTTYGYDTLGDLIQVNQKMGPPERISNAHLFTIQQSD